MENIVNRTIEFGTGLAKIFPDAPGNTQFFYLFYTDQIDARRFSSGGGYVHWLVQAPKHPGTRWETRELKRMEISLNQGHFHWTAD